MRYAKGFLMVFAALAGLVLVVDLPLHAQSTRLSVNVPFGFHVGDKALPAGFYIVERRGEAIVISDSRGSAAAVLSNPIHNKAYPLDNVLIFKAYGDRRFLSEVRWSEYTTARGMVVTETERRLAQVLPEETVKLAAIVR